MAQRNRASGWRHAKLSGHKNEACVKELFDTDPLYRKTFMDRIGYGNETISETSIGGLHEKSVPSVLGGTTKSKTDLKIICESGKIITVSIKKSPSGQVYFVRAGLFIEVYEKQFKETIPSEVQRAINLFWAAADDAITIIEQYGDKSNKKCYDLQIRHQSLNATTLKSYDKNLYDAMLNWFSDHIYNLAKLAFTMGAAKDPGEWSEFVWYINVIGENDINTVFNIEDICKASVKVSKQETYYSNRNGGTTIQLPFGFVQWHQEQLQFHHSYDKICSLINNT